ncbi:thioredoxin-disulfide reductase [Candidatus Parcubacteria bacterium]|nr:MAG: thioredoxin-disulfide reductase [Candidatus Parcubacteria bacterium]
MFDTIIIGAGPAGMTAGIYAARREMKTLIIGKEVGGQVVWASEIENYPGVKKIQSFELIQNFKEHVESFGVEIKTDEVKEIVKKDDFFEIITNNTKYETKTVIVAIGLSPRRLAIKGEEEFAGKGVTYCANCDGPFYRDKEVAVVGGGNSALDAAEMLSKIAKKVYLIHRRDEFKAFEALVSEVKARENIELVLNANISEIKGNTKVEKIEVTNNDGTKKEINVDGVFIEIGRIARTDLVKELAERNERDEILVDEKCRTKTKGLFAAGDVTQIPFKQISSANGQATIAALAAYQYLQLKAGNSADIILDRSIKKNA